MKHTIDAPIDGLDSRYTLSTTIRRSTNTIRFVVRFRDEEIIYTNTKDEAVRLAKEHCSKQIYSK